MWDPVRSPGLDYKAYKFDFLAYVGLAGRECDTWDAVPFQVHLCPVKDFKLFLLSSITMCTLGTLAKTLSDLAQKTSPEDWCLEVGV